MAASKLPVIATVKASYMLALKNISQYSRFISGWLLVSAPIIYFWYLEFAPFLSDHCYSEKDIFANVYGFQLTFGTANYIFDTISVSAGMIIYCSLMVLFSQFLLGKKTETKFPHLLLDDLVWQSFKLPMRIAVYLLILGILGVVLAAFIGFGWIFLIAIGIAVVVFLLLYWPKIMIAIVAIANGYKGMTLEDAIDRTEFNTLRVLGGGILAYLPVVIVSIVTAIIFGGNACESSFDNAALLTIEAMIVMYMTNLFLIPYYTLCYQYFYEGKKTSGS